MRVLLYNFSSITLVTVGGFPDLLSDMVCLCVTVAESLGCSQWEALMGKAAVGSCSRLPGMWHACSLEYTQAHGTYVCV